MSKFLVIDIILKEEKSIDGSLIFQLTEEDLDNELQIKSKIHRKKLLNCNLK